MGLPDPERDRIAAEMISVLRRHVADAWFPRSVDSERGGFFCDFDRAWNKRGQQLRMLEFQARHTRAAARLALAFPAESLWAETALHGFRYLRDRMWDQKHGGWFWMLARDGTPLQQETKHAHSTAYAFRASAVVYAATGEKAALEHSLEGFAWFDRHAHDETFGGYLNWLHRDGSVVKATPQRRTEPLGYRIGLKDINVHGDWIEAMTEFLTIHHDATVESRLRTFLRLVVDHMVTEEGALHNACYRDWRPQPGLERFGHNLQTANHMVAASAYLDDPAMAEAIAGRMLDHALERGWIHGSGGFRLAAGAGPPDELDRVPVPINRRSWWVLFEGLRTLAVFALLTKRAADPPYADRFRATWSLIRDRMCDDAYGGIYADCPDDLPVWQRPFGRLGKSSALYKGDIWKDAGHDTDDLVDCIRLLRRQPTGGL